MERYLTRIEKILFCLPVRNIVPAGNREIPFASLLAYFSPEGKA
jgi:hypothetical protein